MSGQIQFLHMKDARKMSIRASLYIFMLKYNDMCKLQTDIHDKIKMNI
jgi:hypothetical protein